MDKDARKVILRFLLPLVAGITAAFFVLDALTVRLLVFDSTVSGAYKVHRILEEHPADEIPVIGSSRAKCCIVPDSLSVPVFNYGLNGADLGVVAFFLRQALSQQTDSAILVNVDLDWWGHGIGDPANWIPNAGHPDVRALMGPTYRPRHRVPFVRHFGLFDEYLSNVLKERISATEVVTRGAGLLPGSIGSRRMAAMAQALARSSDVSSWMPDGDRLESLTDLVRAHPNRPIVFVLAPMHRSYFRGKSEADMRRATAWLDSLRAPVNAHLLDYSRLDMPDSLFFDLKHLNESGAREFSRRLATDLDSLLGGEGAARLP